MIRVMIVEDDPMARQLLEIYIDKSEKYELAVSIDNAMFAEAYCYSNSVDVILMDVCTAMNANGIEAAAGIKKHLPRVKIIIITSQPECSFIDQVGQVCAHAACGGQSHLLQIYIFRQLDFPCVYFQRV